MQKIRIKNFGPIEDAKIEITKFLVLIGEQASGKSTIAKLIYFFKSLKEDFIATIYQENNSEQDFRIAFIKNIKSKFHLFFGSINYLPPFSIIYFYSNDDKKIEIKKQKDTDTSLHITFSKSFYKSIYRELKDIVRALKDSSTEKNIYEIKVRETERAKYITRLVEILNRLFEDKRPSLYIPAGRNITVSYSNQFKLLFFGELSVEINKVLNSINQELYSTEHSIDMHLMKEFFKEIQAVIDRFENSDFTELIKRKKSLSNNYDDKSIKLANNIIEDILKGKYVRDIYGEKIYFDKENNGYVHLHNASSGQQEIIRILQDLFLIILDKKNVFRIIEEPEAHLYPTAQKRIIELMAIVVNQTDSQIIITTHSPYILSSINNLLYAKKVAMSDKSTKEKIDKIIPKAIQLNSEYFRAYSLKNIIKTSLDENIPYCQTILDNSTGLISQNYLDDVSEELGEEFETLYALQSEIINKGK